MADPILLIKDSTFCYGALYSFAADLGSALERAGARVEYFDFSDGNVGALEPYLGRHFSAMIGFQTPLFHSYLPDIDTYIVDYIDAPKLQMMLDNPLGLPNLVDRAPKDYYLLTHDRDYKLYTDAYFPAVSGTFILPPGANAPKDTDELSKTGLLPVSEREIPVLFLGTYINYRQYLPALMCIHGDGRRIAAKYLKVQRKHPHLPAYELLDLTIEELGLGEVSPEMKKTLLTGLKDVNRCLSFYFKEKVITALIEAGIHVTVFSDSWKDFPGYGSEFLHVEPSVNYDEIPAVMQRSKICLNIMTAHKDGVTERIAQGMLAGCVTISDETRALKETFFEDELLLFRLEDIELLPGRIKALLDDDERLCSIAEKGYKKAFHTLTWDVRAKELLELL